MSNVRNVYDIMQILIKKNISWWKRLTKRYRVFINLRRLIKSAKLNIVFVKIWKLKFNGILFKFKTL